MSQPAFAALSPLPFELIFSDGEPLESDWHVAQMELLKGLIRQVMAQSGRRDYHIGGDNFVYYSLEQAQDVIQGRPYFRGPDVYWVGGVPPRQRQGWVSWEEGGRLPDVIVELLSPSTAHIDRNEKMDLYARVFRTAEYYLCEPRGRKLEGFRLAGKKYRPMVPDDQGRLWSEQLGVSFGLWHGIREDVIEADWIRLFQRDGTLVPTEVEAAELRAGEAEAEVRRLRALLGDRSE